MPRSLQEIDYEPDYRTGYNDIIEDFFRPSLECATTYWRAVGYFSSSALESFGQPLGTFINNGGMIRLITSVHLSERDLDAINNGMEKQRICEKRIDEIIESDFAENSGNGTTRLTRLLELDRLEILVAVPKNGTGIYHEKIGLFFQGTDYVAFTGSSNESRNAFENNRECVDVYPSWMCELRANRKKEHFEALWEGTDKGVDVYSFPDAAKKKLIRVCSEGQSGKARVNPGDGKEHRKWRHQDEAASKFLKAERGILNMATGTGKTHTALKILKELFARKEIDKVIVSADGIDLLEQWHREILLIRNSVDGTVFRHYGDFREIENFLLFEKRSILIVGRHFLFKALNHFSSDTGSRSLLVHDEVHRLGSPENQRSLKGLSNNIRFRLGLSATPERHYDEVGNEFILDHVGPEIFHFGLKQAIQRGILASFNYYPLPYEVTDEDRKRIRSVYSSASAMEANGKPLPNAQLWTLLAKVYKTSKAKLPIFEAFIDKNRNILERCIVFVETQEYGSEVIELIHRHCADFHPYFSGEDSSTLKRFARRELECLVTCHRVSEGIDIQSLNSVILFSSSRSNLETIQRMGRCLRTDPDNLDKVANVVDFIRQPTKNAENNPDEMRKDWLTQLSKVRTMSE